jgi:hypothetical protein
MAESPGRVDLRLRIPASAPYREAAVELAVKFAEYAGASKTAIAAMPASVAAALGRDANPRAAFDLELSAAGGEVTVKASPSRD